MNLHVCVCVIETSSFARTLSSLLLSVSFEVFFFFFFFVVVVVFFDAFVDSSFPPKSR